jgi:hypothetical protein
LPIGPPRKNTVKAAYNHAQYLYKRRKMMQAWADYLDGLKAGRDLIYFKTNIQKQ